MKGDYPYRVYFEPHPGMSIYDMGAYSHEMKKEIVAVRSTGVSEADGLLEKKIQGLYYRL